MANILSPIIDAVYKGLPVLYDKWGNLVYRLVEGRKYEGIIESEEVKNIEVYNFVPVEGFDIVKDKEIIKYEYIEGEKEGVKACVGVDFENDNIWIDLLKGHLMVGGASRWGKSNFLNVLITSIMTNYTPNEVMFIGCDFKKSDIYYFRNFKHFRGMSYNSKQFKEQIDGVYNEMNNRSKILEESNCRNVISYNSKSETKLSYIIFVIDELVLLCEDKDCKSKLHSVMCASASYGIYFILASQDFTKDTIGKCKMNCIQTVGFKTKDKTDSTTLIGEGVNLHEIKNKGECRIDIGGEIVGGQIFYLNEEEMENRLKHLRKEG